MNLPLVIQGIGFIAVLISICIFQSNKRKNMLGLGTAAAVLWAIHFYLLGAYGGAAMNLIGAGRSYVFIKTKPNRKNIWILFIFILIAALATAITWQGLISLLPFIASSAIATAYWQFKPKNIRRLMLIAPPIWFTYNALSGSYPGMIVEVMTLGSILVGRYRFDLAKRHKILASKA